MTLIDFLLKSKLSGYASGSEGQKIRFNDNSIGFEILSDRYRYLDRYYGFNPFVGTEYVFDSNKALLWTMNYFGEVLKNVSESEKIYSFLREAMFLITPESPFRGPSHFEKQSLRYENQQHGSLNHFHGIESIYRDDEKVYVLYYHGGSIKRDM